MRIRTIKPEFFTHEGLFEAEQETGLPIRLAFVGLWCAADREGRFKWEPRRLGVTILPYDNVDFSRVLDACLTRGFLVKYRVKDACFGAIPSWKKHQFVNNREAASSLPEPSEGEMLDACPTRAPRVNDACHKEGKGKEGERKGREHIESPTGDDAQELRLEAEATAALKPTRQRDPLFDALAEAVGANAAEVAGMAARRCGVAVSEIKKATPNVTPEEIKRRAANYKLLMPDVILTDTALAKHWAVCAKPPPGRGTYNPTDPEAY